MSAKNIETFVSSKRGAMPSKKSIVAYWNERDPIVYEYIGSATNQCFACGRPGYTERCHILACCYGGTEDVSNLHLLCMACHHESESVSGVRYQRWLEYKQARIKDEIQWTLEKCCILAGLPPNSDFRTLSNWVETQTPEEISNTFGLNIDLINSWLVPV